ncbi:MAG: DNA-binding transcriptional regulator Fis [Gammaproteobacteria bacterium]
MANDETAVKQETIGKTDSSLRMCVERSIANYFAQLGGQQPVDLYDMVIAEVEAPLLAAIMSFTKGNQSRAAVLLGISRGTLRKKLKIYDLD